MTYDKRLDTIVVRAFDTYRKSEILLEMARETVRQRYDHTLLSTTTEKEWHDRKERLAFAVPPGPTN